MAIVVVDAGSRQKAGAIIMEAWKHGVEAERLHDNQIELTTAYDDKMDSVLGKFDSLNILHIEKFKVVN